MTIGPPPMTLAAEILLDVIEREAALPEKLTPSEWAEKHRVVPPESGSAYPGAWRNARIPYLIEPMDRCGIEDPCRTVTFMAASQCGKTSIGENAIAYFIAAEPRPCMAVQPSIDMVRRFDRTKLTPMFEATPELRGRVLEVVSRDGKASTATLKRFRGGYLVLASAGSSRDLQSSSVGFLLLDEITEYDDDVGGRGSPIDQAMARTKQWSQRGAKTLLTSTPGIEGACAISRRFEAGDQRLFFVPCPSCGVYQALDWEQFEIPEDAPASAYLRCRANGCVIEHDAKRAMLTAGRWIPTFPDAPGNPAPPPSFELAELERWAGRDCAGREPSYRIWTVYSPFERWSDIAKRYLETRGDARAEKTFCQQVLGKAWREEIETPDGERLMERRVSWERGKIPAGVLYLTGGVDVQGDRLELSVWGWDRAKRRYLIDHAVLVGDPNGEPVWIKLDRAIARGYGDAWGRSWAVDRWAIDAGYLSQCVYRYVRRRASDDRICAVDGRAGWRLPAIGVPRKVDVDERGRRIARGVRLWPVGTFDLKASLFAGLRATIRGVDPETGAWPPGAVLLPDFADRELIDQLTAEHLRERKRGATVEFAWAKHRERNEALDCAVYAEAMSEAILAELDDARLDALERERLGPPREAQADMAAIWRAQSQIEVREPEPALESAARSQVLAGKAAPRRRAPIPSADPYLRG